MRQNLLKSYEARSIYFAVTLAGASVPVSEVAEISEINTLSDSAETGSFKSGETRIVLNDPNGDYNIDADENFFTRNGHAADGSGASFSISAGYDAASNNLFEGIVDNVIYDSVNGTATIVALSLAQVLLQEISDFGLPKRFRVAQETEQQLRDALDQGDHRENGVYPVLKALLPPSQDSETLHISLTEQGDRKEDLRTEGTLNNRNFSVSSEGVETEGSALGLTSSQLAAFPQLEMKSPYRWEYFTYTASEILEKFGISNRLLAFYPENIGQHFAPVSRPYYSIIGNTGAEYDVIGSWGGFVTDWVRVSDNIYFLYSIHNTDEIHKSRILKYDLNGHEWEIVHSFAQGVAAWQMALTDDASSIFVMTRDNGDAVSPLDYDSLVSRDNSTVKIQKIAITTDGRDSVSVVANHGSPFRPQIAHYYHVTGAYGMLPDNRGGFAISHGHLIYRYTRGTDKFGVSAMPLSSGATRSLVEATTDGEQNHAGCAFSIRGDILIASFTWRDGVDSNAKDYAFDLSTL